MKPVVHMHWNYATDRVPVALCVARPQAQRTKDTNEVTCPLCLNGIAALTKKALPRATLWCSFCVTRTRNQNAPSFQTCEHCGNPL